eukprot:Sspe_Gene.37589::Locus_18142_Transcript_1_1_Confidence_1.000_Length_1237::g.37589::m.37589/K01373/CTSF; cathepsin F
MKLQPLLLLLWALAGSAVNTFLTEDYVNKYGVKMWQDFKKDFNKKYKGVGQEGSEDHTRFLIFQSNLLTAVKLQEKHKATFGFNYYSDWSDEEFTKMRGEGVLMEPPGVPRHENVFLTRPTLPDGIPLPTSYDARRLMHVSHVKHQGNCSAGTVFASIGAIEGAWAAGGTVLRPLSEQWAISCFSVPWEKCSSQKRPSHVALLIMAAHERVRIPLEEEEPYASSTGEAPECGKKQGGGPVVGGVYQLTDSDEHLRRWLIHMGPFVAGFSFMHELQTYQRGVIQGCKLGPVESSVLIVGFGEEAGVPYWVAKNSWGSAWGDHGYFYIKRGEGCLIDPVAPKIEKEEEEL